MRCLMADESELNRETGVGFIVNRFRSGLNISLWSKAMADGLFDGACGAGDGFMQAGKVLMQINGSPHGTEHGEHSQRKAQVSEYAWPLDHAPIVAIRVGKSSGMSAANDLQERKKEHARYQSGLYSGHLRALYCNVKKQK